MLALHLPAPTSRPSPPPVIGCAPGSSAAAVGAGEHWRQRIRGRTRRGEQLNAFPHSAFPRPSGYAVTAAAAAGSSAGASLGTREEEYNRSAVALEEGAPPPSELAAPLPPSLNPELMPRHVAVIMDGNSRWARERELPTSAGHEAGYRALREMMRLSASWGVKVLTVFAFSTENWFRPKVREVGNFLLTVCLILCVLPRLWVLVVNCSCWWLYSCVHCLWHNQ